MYREKNRGKAEYVPDPTKAKSPVNPCAQPNEFKSNSILSKLSCAAKNNAIYVVATMTDVQNCTQRARCPDGFKVYNTQVAFNKNGTLVGRYHKYNLYAEEVKFFDVPPLEHSYFDTEFGRMGNVVTNVFCTVTVRCFAGMFICYDMVFKSPAVDLVEQFNVTTMLFSTHWFDQGSERFAMRPTAAAW